MPGEGREKVVPNSHFLHNLKVYSMRPQKIATYRRLLRDGLFVFQSIDRRGQLGHFPHYLGDSMKLSYLFVANGSLIDYAKDRRPWKSFLNLGPTIELSEK